MLLSASDLHRPGPQAVLRHPELYANQGHRPEVRLLDAPVE